MAELRKTGANQYEVVVNEEVIGHVWNWHGSWPSQADNRTSYGLKSRKEAIAKVEQIHQLKQ